MARINRNYEKLPGSYLFSEIARRTAAYQEANPEARLIKMGIGDVTRPLAPAVVAAMHAAVNDLAAAETFHGYGPEQGYAFLRDAIAEHDFAARNIAIAPDEIFVSDGAKSDCGNIGDIFAEDNIVAVCDPVYPVYVDTNAMAGRAGDYDADTERWTNIVYMPTTAENDFTPALPDVPVDLIYLCSPNNPTGTVLSREALQRWVDFANATDAVILFDAAYERFIADAAIPHSIYEIPGAKTCAIEFRSFSKTAGFTGARCGYTVVPARFGARGTEPKRDVEPPSNNEVQRRLLCHPARRGGHLHPRRRGPGGRDHRLLPHQRPARSRRAWPLPALRCTAPTTAHTCGAALPMAPTPGASSTCLLEEANVITTPGAGFGAGRRGLYPAHRLRRRRGHQGGGRAHQADARCRESRLAEAHHGIGAQSSPRADC